MESGSRSFIARFISRLKTAGPASIENTTHKGRSGEETAVSYLKKKGLKIVERNYRWRKAEIDIIARDKKNLIFVEVKSSTAKDFDHPLSWISGHKQKQIIKASTGYLTVNNKLDHPVRFDVVAISADGEISHIEDAFRG